MSSASTDPLPTFTISPPPLLLPSAHAHETTIEPASIAISAVIATLVLALLILSFTNKRNNSNSTANKSETKSTPRPLRISGPLGLEHPGDATLQHVPSTTTNPLSTTKPSGQAVHSTSLCKRKRLTIYRPGKQHCIPHTPPPPLPFNHQLNSKPYTPLLSTSHTLPTTALHSLCLCLCRQPGSLGNL
ncbi:hypothetical protein PTNB73_07520 [Pyrenophora teres f. teres]|nr:hypothetical protein PTNB73_07520 [Pyrenophora teres f. teres]